MLRKVLIGAGALAAFYALAAVALLAWFDAGALRPRIEEAFARDTERTLSIDGELRLAVFPRIAVELPKSTLSERGSPARFATFDSARIGVALWPLLAGRIEPGRIQLAGLDATVERRADGSSNVDDLLRAVAPEPQPSATQPGRGGTGIAQSLPRGGLELVDSKLTVIDGGRPVLVLRDVDFSIGALSAGRAAGVKLAAAIAAPEAALSGSMALAGQLHVDATSGSVELLSLRSRLRGAIAGQRTTLQFDATRLRLGREMAGEQLKLQLWPPGWGNTPAVIEVATVKDTAGDIDLQGVRVRADTQSGGRAVSLRLDGAAKALPGRRRLDFAGVSGEVGVAGSAWPAPLKAGIEGSGSLDVAAQMLHLELTAKVDETTIDGTVAVRGFARPRLHVDLRADRLDFGGDLRAPNEPTVTANTGGGRRAFDLAALGSLDLEGSVRVGRLRVAGIEAAEVRTGVRIQAGRVDLPQLEADLYGGRFTGSAFASAEGGARVNGLLRGVAVEPLLRDVAGLDAVSGTADVRLDLAAPVKSTEALRALNGSADVDLRDGAIRGFDLERRLRLAERALGEDDSQLADRAQETSLRELKASFVIADGVVRNDDLDARAEHLRLAGAGAIDLAARRLDYTLRATAGIALRGPDGRELVALRGVAIPVRLAGPFDGVRTEVRWVDAVRATIVPAPRLPGRASASAAAPRTVSEGQRQP